MEILRRLDSINYQPPRTVGTTRVSAVHGDGQEYYTVYLDIKHEDDDGSCYVFSVPRQLGIQKGDTVELIVKEESKLGNFAGRLGAFTTGGKYFDKVWRLAIRKYDPTKYGKGFDNDRELLDKMFDENFGESRGTKAFFERFVKQPSSALQI